MTECHPAKGDMTTTGTKLGWLFCVKSHCAEHVRHQQPVWITFSHLSKVETTAGGICSHFVLHATTAKLGMKAGETLKNEKKRNF